MGEGLARAVTIGSIVLTVASLTFAVIFARKKSKIRPGFDLTRAAIGIAAIIVMAAVTRINTTTVAFIVAVLAGLALGFAQGLTLKINREERGLYARRSPLGVVLWGAGIVTMQVAGLASRTGTVRLGQTLAWFSACLGIGLMVGRTGPMKRTLAGAGVAAAVTALMLPSVAAIAGTVTPAAAQEVSLTDEEICSLTPTDRSPSPGLDNGFFFELTLAPIDSAIAGCASQGFYDYTALDHVIAVFLFASPADARNQFEIEIEAAAGVVPGLGGERLRPGRPDHHVQRGKPG